MGRGRPKREPTSLRSIRMPVRLWRLVEKTSKNHRSVNDFIQVLVEDNLVKNEHMSDKDRKRPYKSKTKTGGK